VFDVAPVPTPLVPPAPPQVPQQPATTSTTTTPSQPVAGPKGTVKVARRLRARRGRFTVKLAFAPGTPTGTATLVVRSGTKQLGSVKVPVRPGQTVKAKVKLTKAGQRLLKRRGTLKVKLVLTVNGAVTKRALTLKR
jgi:hypothetical protein